MSTPKTYIYDHTFLLKRTSKRRTIFGQSIKASTFFICLLVLILSAPITFIIFRLTSNLPGPPAIRAILFLPPSVIPVFATYALLESKTNGDSFLEFLRKRAKFKLRTNYKKENNEKYVYAIGMAPKARIIEGQTLFMPASVEIPKNISNLSGYDNGEPEDETFTVNDGIILGRRD